MAATNAKCGSSVAVVGGGVAGIAAASALADNGIGVNLYEKRPLLGGRASSWLEHETGERLDACQHGTMRCCTNLTALLTSLGVADQIRYHDAIHFLDGDGKRSVITGCGLPAPGHTSLSFLMFKSLTIADKIAIGRGMMLMLRAKMDSAADQVSIEDWFQKTRQTERAVKRFWEPILVSACNETMDRISCTHAFKIFRDGFLCHPTAFHFGVPRLPFGSLYTEPTIQYIESRGGTVNLKSTIDRVNHEKGRLTSLETVQGETVQADYYVFALQQDLLLKLVPEELTTGVDYFEKLRSIETSPIVGVHLWFEGKIDAPEALALLDKESDWIFNKNLNFDLVDKTSTYLSVVISGSRELTAKSKEDILEIVLADVHFAIPQTRSAKLLKSYVLKERKATFSPKVGIESLRPTQRSPIPNMFIAGEWTQTGWPSTMEGAARSGYLAAEAVLESTGHPKQLLACGLPLNGLAKLLTRV